MLPLSRKQPSPSSQDESGYTLTQPSRGWQAQNDNTCVNVVEEERTPAEAIRLESHNSLYKPCGYRISLTQLTWQYVAETGSLRTAVAGADSFFFNILEVFFLQKNHADSFLNYFSILNK